MGHSSHRRRQRRNRRIRRETPWHVTWTKMFADWSNDYMNETIGFLGLSDRKLTPFVKPLPHFKPGERIRRPLAPFVSPSARETLGTIISNLEHDDRRAKLAYDQITRNTMLTIAFVDPSEYRGRTLKRFVTDEDELDSLDDSD